MFGRGLSAAGRFLLIGSSSLMFNRPSTVEQEQTKSKQGEKHALKWMYSRNIDIGAKNMLWYIIYVIV